MPALTEVDLTELRGLVVDTARAEIVTRFRRVAARVKSDGSLLTDADLAVQAQLSARLAARWPGVAILGEEMSAQQQQALFAGGKATFWCLDPLDGTGNFACGLPYFAVSLALVEEGRAVAGVVYDPIRDECFSARRAGGARLNGEPLVAPNAPPQLDGCLAIVDMKRLPVGLRQRLAERPPYRSQRSFGAVALEWCWLAAGRGQLYLHGGQKLWDHAAGALILEEAGGVACLCATPGGDCETSPVLSARAALGAADRSLFEAWRRWIAVD